MAPMILFIDGQVVPRLVGPGRELALEEIAGRAEVLALATPGRRELTDVGHGAPVERVPAEGWVP